MTIGYSPAGAGGKHLLDISACTDASTADHHANRAGLYVQRLNVMAKVEWAAHHGVGIHGQEHVADEEIERRAVDLQARNLHALNFHGGLAARGANARRHADRALAGQHGDQQLGAAIDGLADRRQSQIFLEQLFHARYIRAAGA